ncbi:MAG: acetoin utilization protein AcuC [Candidatus Aminicenantes bacterium]|nr:acetoin utilization protein AcuC [Candidatus Aminicenantes bacterium]
MKDLKAVFLYSPEWDEVKYPQDCPFDTGRAGKTRNTIRSMGLLGGSRNKEIEPVIATRAELEKFHDPAYLDAIKNAEKGELPPEAFAMGIGTPDCPVFRGMYDYFSLASGASLTGARLILSGEANVAFNPAGGFHHAGPGSASGFCFINDVVLAAVELSAAGKRVLFLDLDVHHGDGVEKAFYERNDVLTISMHESGKTLFPGTGAEADTGSGAGKGYAVNIPLPVGTYDAAYERAFRRGALPLIFKFNPDVIILELGMDALSGDPLAHLNLTNNAYVGIIKEILKLEKPILATGGGGYNVEATVRGWALVWSILCGEDDHDMGIGMGGVFLETSEWLGGLRDRVLITDAGIRDTVDAEIERVIRVIEDNVFPIHGCSPTRAGSL